MKTLIAILLAVVCSGCINSSKLVKELAKDNSSLVLQVNTIYGSMRLVRSNPKDNGLQITPEGSVNVPQPMPPPVTSSYQRVPTRTFNPIPEQPPIPNQ